jgi:hypothetical protein
MHAMTLFTIGFGLCAVIAFCLMIAFCLLYRRLVKLERTWAEQDAGLEVATVRREIDGSAFRFRTEEADAWQQVPVHQTAEGL